MYEYQYLVVYEYQYLVTGVRIVYVTGIIMLSISFNAYMVQFPRVLTPEGV